MGYRAGAIQAGSSVVSNGGQGRSEAGWIDNSGGAEWLTIDNRCSLGLAVAPSQAAPAGPASGPATTYLSSSGKLLIPALTRCSVPIDPEQGIGWELVADHLLGMRTDLDGVVSPSYSSYTVAVRTCPFALHDSGAAMMAPLYPIERCLQVTRHVTAQGAGVRNSYWVEPSADLAGFAGAALLEGATPTTALGRPGPDTCIVGINFLPLTLGAAGTLNNLVIGLYTDYDPTGAGSIALETDAALYGGGTGVSEGPAIYPLPGVCGVSILNAAGNNLSWQATFFVGLAPK